MGFLRLKNLTPCSSDQEIKKIQIINIKMERIGVNAYATDVKKIANNL